MRNKQTAERWKEYLKMEEPPVAIAFVDKAPGGIDAVSEPAPSACTFWRRGQKQLFYATAEDHNNCPIGLMTMGFDLSQEKAEQARSLVETMASLHYFAPSEVSQLPAVQKKHDGILYGPLDRFPVDPDLVLLLLTPYQSMLAAEALGQVTWAETAELGLFGRPACAALAKVMSTDKSNISLGCIGARTYTDMGQEEMMLVVPGRQLEQASARLAEIIDANQKLEDYHSNQRRAI